MSESLHAAHNEEVCDFLLESKRYNDWVVTTAFYSALHFVQNDIFPITIKGKKYNTFNKYYWRFAKKNNENISKHSATIDAVKKHNPKCYSYYKSLHDSCMNARYREYNISYKEAVTARNRLAEMKKHLKSK